MSVWYSVCLSGRRPESCVLSSSSWKVIPICPRYLCTQSRKQGWPLHLTPPPPGPLAAPRPGWQDNHAPDLIVSPFPPACMAPSRLWPWVRSPPTMSGVTLCYALYFPVCRGSCHCLCRKTRLGPWPSLASSVDKGKGVRPYSAFQGAGWVLTQWLPYLNPDSYEGEGLS